MQEDKTGIRELVWLTRLKQPTLQPQESPPDGFSAVSAGDDCALGCACLPWDFCDCPCHRFVPTKRAPDGQTPVL